MINNKIKTTPNFVSQAQLLVPIMHHHLSGDQHKKIVLSKSLSITKPFIILAEEADASCITLEEFLALLDARVDVEFAYCGEITNLKDNICEEFNKLFDGATGENFLKFVRDQRQRIIDAVMDEAKIDQKMIAEQFYSDMINGWAEKALNVEQFDKFVYTIFWEPLLTPLPIEALDKLRELIKGLENEKSIEKIENIVTLFINYMKLNFTAAVIKDSDYDAEEALRAALDELVKKRQICNIEVTDISQSGIIVEDFRGKCVSSVKIIIDLQTFLEEEIKFFYDKLEINDLIEGKDLENSFSKIQKKINWLKMELGGENINNLEDSENYEDYEEDEEDEDSAGSDSNENNQQKDTDAINICLDYYNKLEKLLSKFQSLEYLNLIFNGEIGEVGAKSLSIALNKLKKISNLDLYLENNNIRLEGAIAISSALKELKNISTLSLNLGCNDMGDEGAKAISSGLSDLKGISVLNLNFVGNNINLEGAKTISSALKELKNISTLTLNLGCNKIKKEGAVAISFALKELKNISTLNMNFEYNKIQKEGAIAISAALQELKNILTLNLDLNNNKIEKGGAIAISTAMKELKNISTLTLNLWLNNIGAEGATGISSAVADLKNISTLDLNLRDNKIGDEGAKAVSNALGNLKKMSVLTLWLQGNNINTEGAIAIIAELENLKHISSLILKLENNKIGKESKLALRELEKACSNYEISL